VFLRPPWSIVAYVVSVLILVAIALPHERRSGALPGALILLAACVGLVLAIWLAWAFLVVLEVGNFIVVAVEWPAWWIVVGKAAMVALLLVPATRRYPRWPRFLRRWPALSGSSR
jgi:hypothetical protein